MTNKTELMGTGETASVTTNEKPDIMTCIMSLAKDDTFDADKMRVLVDMKNDHDDREAKKSFNRSLVEFNRNPPRILKNAVVDFASKGGRTTYKHATIDSVLRQLRQPLFEIGFAARWRIENVDNDEKVKVTCILSHTDGFSEESSLKGKPDTSGGKNLTQGGGSIVTYLKRYTLLAVLGLAEEGEDSDGVQERIKQPIDAEQIAQIENLIEETGVDLKQFCKFKKIGAISEMDSAAFGLSVKQLNAKKG